MAVVQRWTSVSTDLLLQCHHCGAKYRVNVQAMADGHGQLSSQLAGAKLQREVGKHVARSPHPCPKCGMLDAARAQLQGQLTLWGVRSGILVGGCFGAFVVVVSLTMAATRPPGTLGGFATPVIVGAWVVAVAISILIRRRFMPLPFSMNNALLASRRRDSKWAGDGSPATTLATPLALRGWMGLLFLAFMLAIPLFTGVGPSLTSGSTSGALGLTIASGCFFAVAAWSAGKAGRLVRGESESVQPAGAQAPAGDRAKAEALYQEARKHMQVGGVKAEGLRLLTAAIAADPTLADAYDARSNVYSSMGRADEALADIEKCGELKKAGKPPTRDNTIGGLSPGLDEILKRSGL